ncbi:hypothetical protein [Rhizobium aegyptiacum]|nr:hypothetical protein [Rhizobium aegyptiacum]
MEMRYLFVSRIPVKTASRFAGEPAALFTGIAPAARAMVSNAAIT